MKDRRTLVMLVVLATVVVLGGFYLFADRDGDGDGSGAGVAVTAGAVVLLVLIAFVGAGASRNKRVVRDEEEREDG